jgi:hypothetical protein
MLANTHLNNTNAHDRPDFYLIGKKSSLPIGMIGNVGNVISSPAYYKETKWTCNLQALNDGLIVVLVPGVELLSVGTFT